MKIYSWNINGVRAVTRKDALLPFINESNADVICLQETKAQPDQIEIKTDDYHLEVNSAERKGHFGTAILSRSKPLSVIKNIPEDIANKYNLEDKYGNTNNEGRVLFIELNDYWIGSVYTPNAKDDLSRIPMRQNWDPAYLELLQRLEENGKPVIACGDFNVAHTEDDLARPKPNKGKKGFTDEERDGMSAFIDAGFIDSLRQFKQGNGYYTWWSFRGGARSRNVGWRIDYILTSNSLKTTLKAADIHPDVMGSDHCPVSIEI